MIILVIFLSLFLVHQTMFWLWYWQLKEYRRDRLIDGLKNETYLVVIRQFDLFSWYRPKWTARAFLALLSIMLVLGFYCWFFMDYLWLLLLVVPLVVTGTIGFWTPLFNWLRAQTVSKAKAKMQSFKGQVIGITGSYGKSSTKEKIAWVLATKYKVVKTPHNFNSLIGIAQTILKDMKGDEDFFVVEMGAYRRGEIKEMCELVKPRYGIITGLGDQHVSLFGSLENIKKAKMELIEALPGDGFGLVAERDFTLSEAKNIKQTIEGISFVVGKQPYWIGVKGKDKLRNVVGSIKMLTKLGMSTAQIALAFKTMPVDFFHPTLTKVGLNYLLDDSYNASLESVEAAVDYLKVFKGYEKMLVTSGLMELGERSIHDHQELALHFDTIDRIIITNKKNYLEFKSSNSIQLVSNFNTLKKEIVTWMKGKRRVVLFSGRTFAGLLAAVKKEWQ